MKKNTHKNLVRAEAASVTIEIIGDIWEGMAAEVSAQIKGSLAMVSEATGAPARVIVDIHSGGGSVFDGWRIYNLLLALRERGHRVDVQVNALAASMASVIAMAGDSITIPANGWIMIHEPWAMSIGAADELRREADLLERMRDQLVDAYQARTGIGADEIKAMMAEETWLEGARAVELKFADYLLPAVAAAALAVGPGPAARWRKAPAAIAAACGEDPPPVETAPKPDDDPATHDVAVAPDNFTLETQDEQDVEAVDPPPVPEGEPAEGEPTAGAGEQLDPAAPRAGWVQRIRDALGGAGELRARCERAEARAAGLEDEVAALRTRCTEAEAESRELEALEAALAQAEQEARDAARKAADVLAATGVAAACDAGDDLPSPCSDPAPTPREAWLAMPAGTARAAYYQAHRAEIERGA